LNYYFSAGYLEDNGVIENSGFNRISTRLNVDYQAKKWLKFGTSLGYTNSKSNIRATKQLLLLQETLSYWQIILLQFIRCMYVTLMVH
jgi:hypothetical protein